MKNYLFLLAAAASFTFTSCGNDDDEVVTPPAPTRTELLTNKNWKATAETTNGTDTFTFKDACEKDDILRFTADMKLTFDEGPTKCDPSDPQTTTGTWAFANNETKLVLTDDASGFSLNFDINELTATQARLTHVMQDTFQGVPLTITTVRTFTAQ